LNIRVNPNGFYFRPPIVISEYVNIMCFKRMDRKYLSVDNEGK